MLFEPHGHGPFSTASLFRFASPMLPPAVLAIIDLNERLLFGCPLVFELSNE